MTNPRTIVTRCIELAKTKGTVEDKVAQSRGRENYTFNDNRGLKIQYKKSVLGLYDEVKVELTEVRAENQGKLVLMANVRKTPFPNGKPIEIKKYESGSWEEMLDYHLGKTKPVTKDPLYDQMSEQNGWA